MSWGSMRSLPEEIGTGVRGGAGSKDGDRWMLTRGEELWTRLSGDDGEGLERRITPRRGRGEQMIMWAE